MKSLLLVIIGLFLFHSIQAQQTTFSKVIYNDIDGWINGLSIAPSIDSGYIIVGESGALLKIDPRGEPLWGKTLSISVQGKSINTKFTDVISTNDSCLLIIGTATAYNWANKAIYLKIDSDGQILWSRAILDVDFISPLSVSQTSDSGFIITGETAQKAFFCKIDKSGGIEWLKKAYTGEKRNVGLSIQETDSSYIASGFFELSGYYGYNGFLISLSHDGEINWAKNYDIINSEPYSMIQDVVVNDIGYIIYLDTGGHVCIVQTDPTGEIIWTKFFSWLYGGRYYQTPYNSISALSDGGYAFTYGEGSRDGGVIKIDSVGNPEFRSDLFFMPSKVIETATKEYMVFGTGPLLIGKGSQSTYYNTGVILIDSIGAGQHCVSPREPSAINDTVLWKQLEFTLLNAESNESIQLFDESSLEVLSIDGCVDVFGSSEEITLDPHCKVYPNPTDGILNIELIDYDKGAFTLFNSLGKEVLQLDLHNENTSIDFTSYSDGIYFFRIVFTDKIITSSKVVISR